MRCTFSKTLLSAALTRCSAIAGTRATLPILANVLVAFSCKGVRLVATDLETGYETFIEATETDLLDQTFTTTVSAKKIQECVKAIPTSDIDIELDLSREQLHVSGGTVRYTLQGAPAEDFPALPAVAGADFTLDAPALVQLLTAVAYAQCISEDKYNLCGCFLQIDTIVDRHLLTAVATDGHRLALHQLPLPGELRDIPADLSRGVIIPTKGVANLCKIKTTGVIVLNSAGNSLCVATDSEKLYLRLIDGEFPQYQRMLVTDPDQRIQIKRPALLDALNRCRIMSDREFHGVAFATAEDGQALTLTGELPDIGGRVEDRVTADLPEEPVSLRLNAAYLIQALETMDEVGVVEITMKQGGLSPIQVQPLGVTQPLAIIMPMRGA